MLIGKSVMKRQRVSVSSLDPTRPLLFHQQSLASVTGCKQPTLLIFPDQTCSIGLPITSELRQSFTETSPSSRSENVPSSQDSPPVSAGESIIIVCTPTAADLNSDMSLFVLIVALQLTIFSFNHVPHFVYSFLLLHLLLVFSVSSKQPQGVVVYQTLLTASSLLAATFASDLLAVLSLNGVALIVGRRLERKLTAQTLISVSTSPSEFS